MGMNPAEILRGIARALARQTGRQVDEDAFNRAAAHLEQRITFNPIVKAPK